jgi:hypothetical protein
MTRDEEDQAIYAVALLTRSELTSLGPAFARAWPVERTPCFGELLAAIDDADRDHWQREDRAELLPSQRQVCE